MAPLWEAAVRFLRASCDMMLDIVIGKTREEAIRYADIFDAMIKGTANPEEIEELDEAAALEDVSHMPARVKCALLGWRTLKEILIEGKNEGSGSAKHCDIK